MDETEFSKIQKLIDDQERKGNDSHSKKQANLNQDLEEIESQKNAEEAGVI